MQGKLIVFSGPSGSGKSTIVKKLQESKVIKAEFSVSATSRQPRGHEKNGEHYYFLTSVDFKQKVNNNDFIEWQEVYKNQFYGTLKSEADRIRNKGNHVLFDIDAIGGTNIKKLYGDDALTIFIKPPSLKILEERLINRSTETPESLKKRIEKAEYELSFAEKFDYILINEILDTAVDQVKDIVLKFINKSI